MSFFQGVVRVLQFGPSTLDPGRVGLIIYSGFIKMDSLRKAFPEARILDRHLYSEEDYGSLDDLEYWRRLR